MSITPPNYRLKNDHVATCGHVRALYQRVVDEFRTKQDSYSKDFINEAHAEFLKKDGTVRVTNTLTYQTEPLLSAREDIPNVGWALDNLAQKLSLSGGTMTGRVTLSADATDPLHATTKQQVDAGLATKKNTGTFDTKIQNATNQTAISCDSDRYISVRSMGTKLGDILEDEQNAGMTILTSGTKRFNVVSGGPQTLYHNSGQGLFNIKYTDDGNTTAGQIRYGQLQLAPSNTTTLNPALTLVSSRVNGLGTVGSVFLDSTYGQTSTPLVFSPQSLTDAGGNQLTMFRSTATLPAGALRNTFSGTTGSSVAVTQPDQFATKSYVDTAISGIDIPEASDPSTLIDKQPSDGALYKVSVENNKVNFWRGADGTDQYLEVFGGALGTGSTETIYGKRDVMRFATLGQDQSRSTFSFSSGVEVQPANPTAFTTNGIFRIETGTAGGQAYVQLYANKLQQDGTQDGDNTSMLFYPRQAGSTKTNFIEFREGVGYSTDADFTSGQDDNSILSRAQADARYVQQAEIPATDRITETAQDPVEVVCENNKIQFKKDGVTFYEYFVNQFGETVQRRPQTEFTDNQVVFSSQLPLPDRSSWGYTIVNESGGFREEYPQFQISQEKDDSVRLASYIPDGLDTQFTRLFLHPASRALTNHIEADRLLGYRQGVTLPTPNDQSILSRSQGDARWTLQTDFEQALNEKADTDRKLNQFGAPDDNVNMNFKNFLNVASPLFPGNVTNKEYVDSQLQLKMDDYASLSRLTAPTNAFSFGFQKITNLASPTLFQDAANKDYVDTAISNALSSGGGGGGSQLTANDCVFLASSGAQASLRNGDNNFALDLFGYGGLITQRGNTALQFRAQDNVTLDGGQMLLYTAAQTDGLTIKMRRKVGYFDLEAVTDNKQFTHKKYVDDLAASKLPITTRLNDLVAPNGDVSLNNFKVTNVANPVSAQDVATKSWVEAQLQALGISSYPPSYAIRIQVGDFPSSIESAVGTGDKDYPSILQTASYSDSGNSTGSYTCFLNGLPFGTGNYEVICQFRSLRTTISTVDNDTSHLVVFNKQGTRFSFFAEETFNVTQNLAIICLIVPSP